MKLRYFGEKLAECESPGSGIFKLNLQIPLCQTAVLKKIKKKEKRKCLGFDLHVFIIIVLSLYSLYLLISPPNFVHLKIPLPTFDALS